jgi:hypothetical protein
METLLGQDAAMRRKQDSPNGGVGEGIIFIGGMLMSMSR